MEASTVYNSEWNKHYYVKSTTYEGNPSVTAIHNVWTYSMKSIKAIIVPLSFHHDSSFLMWRYFNCVPTSLSWSFMASSAMPRQVVQVQPESRVQEAGQWSTGLCECHKDVGDCKCANIMKYIHYTLIIYNCQKYYNSL